MDVLVVLGTSAAWLYGFAKLWVGHASSRVDISGHDAMQMEHDMTNPIEHYLRMEILMHTHNWEMSSTLIVVIIFGKLLEAISKKRTVDKLA
jgi:cation transport ATPase